MLREAVQRAAHWVRWHAEARGLTLDELAVYARISRSSVFNINGGRAPNLRTLAYVAAYLGIEIGELLKPIPEDGKGGE